jgi:asparagine synthase (glutamine-hydrolysing)
VVVHAYEEWGQDCVKRFNGMWAFAIWDQRRRQIFCSRDRFGIKPFYYHLGQHTFVFASEIKGLLPALEKRPDANLRVLSDYLIDGSLCRTNETFFEGIERLEPAHNLVVSSAGSWKTRYWNYTDASGATDAHSPVDLFRELLNDSVKLRLRSDVAIGVALSGGIDSSSILALAARAMNPHSLKAFTAVFPGETYDESQYAELATRATGVELIRIDYQPGDFGSEQEFGKRAISRGFPENREFGLGDGHALSFEEQVA